MASKLPYMANPGLIPKILGKIQEARRPERFTQDLLETKLGFAVGGARAIISLLKRMGFLSSDGTPTKLYDQFRNADTQGGAMSVGIKNAFAELFERNEYAHDLPKEKLYGLITEITGASKDDTTTKCTVSTFLALKEFADFEAEISNERTEPPAPMERWRFLRIKGTTTPPNLMRSNLPFPTQSISIYQRPQILTYSMRSSAH